MAASPFVHDSSLIPPFVYRIPIHTAIFSSSMNRYSWQDNYDIKDRLYTIRLFIASKLPADDFLEERSLESLDIEGIIYRFHSLESSIFNARNASEYEDEVAKFASILRKIHGQNQPEIVPSLTELSFRAVWRQMTMEEQEEFALQSNSIDAVHDLRRFIYQKTTPTRRTTEEEKRSSQKETPEQPSKQQMLKEGLAATSWQNTNLNGVHFPSSRRMEMRNFDTSMSGQMHSIMTGILPRSGCQTLFVAIARCIRAINRMIRNIISK